ncbi:MAG: nuclear transport factor 2 family protein [Dehalobacterium sp.]
MNEKSVQQQEQNITAELTKLVDRMQVSELLSHYCSIVDDKCISVTAVAAIFTPDGRYVSPNGAAVVGSEAIAAEKAKTFSRFRATHHVTSDHIIDLEKIWPKNSFWPNFTNLTNPPALCSSSSPPSEASSYSF